MRSQTTFPATFAPEPAASPRGVRPCAVTPRGLHRARGRQHSAGHGGFTLLEILLVVALLVIVSSMAMPAFMAAFRTATIQEGATQIREAIARTRINAITTGLIYQVRYETDGQLFVGVPFEDEGTLTSGQEEDTTVVLKTAAELDPDLTFRPTQGDETRSEKLSADDLSGLPDAGRFAAAGWSKPILMYPDGTASDGLFEIVDQRNNMIQIRVRGLTGAPSVSQIMGAEQQ